MRQSGILAAAVLHALDHHLDRLVDDHDNAKTLARKIDGVGGATVVFPDTNIVMVDLPDDAPSAKVVAAAKREGVLVAEWTPTRVRMVTHLDISADDAERAAHVVCHAVEQVKRAG